MDICGSHDKEGVIGQIRRCREFITPLEDSIVLNHGAYTT